MPVLELTLAHILANQPRKRGAWLQRTPRNSPSIKSSCFRMKRGTCNERIEFFSCAHQPQTNAEPPASAQGHSSTLSSRHRNVGTNINASNTAKRNNALAHPPFPKTCAGIWLARCAERFLGNLDADQFSGEQVGVRSLPTEDLDGVGFCEVCVLHHVA